MNIYELIEWLQEQPDKEMDVLLAAPTGWFSVCSADSGPEELEGEMFFLLKPCYGHTEDGITVDLKAGDLGDADKN